MKRLFFASLLFANLQINATGPAPADLKPGQKASSVAFRRTLRREAQRIEAAAHEAQQDNNLSPEERQERLRQAERQYLLLIEASRKEDPAAFLASVQNR